MRGARLRREALPGRPRDRGGRQGAHVTSAPSRSPSERPGPRRAVRVSGLAVAPLERLGYLFVPAPESPDYHFFGRPRERPRAFHVHVCAAGSAHELRHVAVRDFLRAHPGEAQRYGALKRDVAVRHPEDRLAYIEGKDAYVAALERRASCWARGRS